jgi:D-lactate dehydrogenase
MLIQHFHSSEEYKTYIQESLQNHTNIDHIFTASADIVAEEVDSTAEIITVFVHTQVTAEHLDLFPNLKCILTRSTGFDHIDLAEAKKRGITVSNVPFYGENTVAEHTFALLLAIARSLPRLITRTSLCNFEYKDLRGFDLQGKTIGVIGTGHIGMHTVKIAHGFGMKVLAFDVVQNSFLPKVLDYEYVSFDDLLAQSDIITLHAPYNEKTRHMIDAESINKMKDGVVIINTSRGALIRNEDLFDAVKSGKVAAVGLDVLENEEDLLNCVSNPLLEQMVTHNRIFFTPHTGYYTQEAQQRIWQTTVENIAECVSGNHENVVNG